MKNFVKKFLILFQTVLSSKPNVIILLADDLGIGDVSGKGQSVEKQFGKVLE